MNKLDEIFMPVEKVDCRDILPDYNFPNSLSHAVVVHTNSGPRIVNYCSELYQLTPNKDIFDKVNKEITKYFDVDINHSMRDFSKFKINFLLKQKPLFFNKKDTIFPTFTLTNSYDSSRKFSAMMGFQRLICTNGMMAPVNHEMSNEIKLVHTPKLGEWLDMDEIMPMISQFMANSGELFNQYEELAYQGVNNLETRVESVIEDTQFPVNLIEDVLYRIEQERLALSMKDYNDWLVYCGFNYQLNHNLDFKAKDQKKEEIDMQVFNYLDKY